MGSGPPPAAVAETHISTVFFAGDRTYKLLKPIRTSFLDHRSVDARLAAVDLELALNRRLTPDVYLGTADVHEDGTLVDRFLVMRRLPAERRLSTRLRDGDTDALRPVVRAVARFHAGLEPLRGIDAAPAEVGAVAANWQGNFADIAAAGLVDEHEQSVVATRVAEYLATAEKVFARRIDEGWIRDGHGDLTAEDIFVLDDGPRILDCLAFDARLRRSDVLADIGFLVMDVERLAGPFAAMDVMAWYRELTNEHHPPSLAHFYVAYRAHVRAKVECLRHDQAGADAASAARRYHALAAAHLERARLRLVLVGGGPGAGKSTLAQALAHRTGWSLLDSDELRKDLAGIGHDERAVCPPGTGLYTPAMTARVYERMLQQAGAVLGAGHSVVLDASWTDPAHRDAARALARERGVDVVELACECDRAVRRERVAARLRAGGGPSDATPEVVDHLDDVAAPWPEATTVATDGPAEQALERALDAVWTPGARLKA